MSEHSYHECDDADIKAAILDALADAFGEDELADDSDVEDPEPHSIDDPWYFGARSDW